VTVLLWAMEELVASVVVALVIYVFVERSRAAMEHRFDEKVEKVRADLKREEIRFSTCHEKVADVIAELYARLVDCHDSVSQYVTHSQCLTKDGIRSRREAVETAILEFWRYFARNRIYLPRETAQRIRTLQVSLLQASNRFSSLVAGNPDAVRQFEEWDKVDQVMEGQVNQLLETLESDFRTTLDVEGPSIRPPVSNVCGV